MPQYCSYLKERLQESFRYLIGQSHKIIKSFIINFSHFYCLSLTWRLFTYQVHIINIIKINTINKYKKLFLNFILFDHYLLLTI